MYLNVSNVKDALRWKFDNICTMKTNNFFIFTNRKNRYKQRERFVYLSNHERGNNILRLASENYNVDRTFN